LRDAAPTRLGGGLVVTTTKGALLPGASLSPLVRVAVRLTPDSATEYVAPTTVHAFDPSALVATDKRIGNSNAGA